MENPDDRREADAYGQFRRFAAVVLVFLVAILTVADVIVGDYEASPVILGLLLGSLCVLLGVEAGLRLLK